MAARPRNGGGCTAAAERAGPQRGEDAQTGMNRPSGARARLPLAALCPFWPAMTSDTLPYRAAAEPSALPDPEPRPAGERIAPWQARAAIAHMQAHLAGTVTLADLAAAAGVSPFHFSRGFRNAIGEPPLRHLARLRIRAACSLLCESDAPVAQIAATVGYRSPQAFARAFERFCGCPPTVWRARGGDASGCCNDSLASP